MSDGGKTVDITVLCDTTVVINGGKIQVNLVGRVDGIDAFCDDNAKERVLSVAVRNIVRNALRDIELLIKDTADG